MNDYRDIPLPTLEHTANPIVFSLRNGTANVRLNYSSLMPIELDLFGKNADIFSKFSLAITDAKNNPLRNIHGICCDVAGAKAITILSAQGGGALSHQPEEFRGIAAEAIAHLLTHQIINIFLEEPETSLDIRKMHKHVLAYGRDLVSEQSSQSDGVWTVFYTDTPLNRQRWPHFLTLIKSVHTPWNEAYY